jgi:hypothetical protein
MNFSFGEYDRGSGAPCYWFSHVRCPKPCVHVQLPTPSVNEFLATNQICNWITVSNLASQPATIIAVLLATPRPSAIQNLDGNTGFNSDKFCALSAHCTHVLCDSCNKLRLFPYTDSFFCNRDTCVFCGVGKYY